MIFSALWVWTLFNGLLIPVLIGLIILYQILKRKIKAQEETLSKEMKVKSSVMMTMMALVFTSGIAVSGPIIFVIELIAIGIFGYLCIRNYLKLKSYEPKPVHKKSNIMPKKKNSNTQNERMDQQKNHNQ